jgi:hypothetical protein
MHNIGSIERNSHTGTQTYQELSVTTEIQSATDELPFSCGNAHDSPKRRADLLSLVEQLACMPGLKPLI